MDTAQETEQIEQIPIEQIELLPPLPPQHEGYIALRQQGVKQTDAVQQVGFSIPYGTKLEQKYNKYLMTGNAKLLKLAHTNVKNMLDLDNKTTKDSTKATLIGMIYDRNDPKISHTENVNMTMYVPVDSDRWKR